MALLHNRTREKIHKVKERVSVLEMGQQKLEELVNQQNEMVKRLNESVLGLETVVMETKEALSGAQTWVVFLMLILVGYSFYKGVKKSWSRVQENRIQETQLKELQQQVEALSLLVVKKEEEPVGLSLSPREEKRPLKKKRSKKN